VLACSCVNRSKPEQAQQKRPEVAETVPGSAVVRATGIVQALESQSVRTPQMTGTSGPGGSQITLTRIVPNGSKVSKGDILVEFDRLTLLDQERDAKALLDDLGHQLEQRKAEVRSLQATRASQIREAQADLEKAQLQLKKGPVLSDLDRQKNEAKADNSKLRLASLNKSDEWRTKSEEASVRILDLKLQRQQVTLERLHANLERLVIKAPQDGMVSHEITWRMGNMGPPQVGDRMWPGMPLLRIFNPAKMVVQVTVDEPDFASVANATHARVYLDAYPGVTFDATLQSASPVATAGLDSPVRNFVAIYRIEQQSPQLLPDLSAALEIEKSKRDESTHRAATVRERATTAVNQ
jgi:multidrug efflux pump subunit AcrA (membrane-fusion protein)